MDDLERAIDQITVIRGQIARTTEFRGYGPVAHALTGCLAILAAIAQMAWIEEPTRHVASYLAIWFTVAALSIATIGYETYIRSIRLHGALAGQMLLSAVEQFIPAVAAGGLLTVVLLRVTPANAWMLPGLWQIVFSLGAFASRRFLPRPMFVIGVWYLAAGLLCLSIGQGEGALSPWLMGIPFGVGQWLVSAVLYTSDHNGKP
jgi:hypothetical protein